MSKQGETTQIVKGKTPYDAIWSVKNGQIVPLQMTISESKTIAARGLKQAALMPELEPFKDTGSNAPFGFINILDLGCRADYDPGINEYKWTNNSRIIQEYLDNLPLNTKPRLYAPPVGNRGYWFGTPIITRRGKGLHMRGNEGLPYLYQEGIASKFIFGMYYAPSVGFQFEAGALTSTLADLFLVGAGNMENPVAGIYHENVMQIDRVYAEHFTDGLYAAGDIETGGNSSLSVYNDCRAAHNKRDGFVNTGRDANRIRYSGIIAVENGRWGIKSNSFLGCTYINHQTELNGAGGWGITSATAEDVWIGGYDEGGQRSNFITPDNGKAIVFEGINPNGYTGSLPGEPVRKHGGYVRRGKSTNEESTKFMNAVSARIAGLEFKESQNYGEDLKVDLSAGTTSFVTLAKPGVPTELLSVEVNHLPTGKRSFIKQMTIINGASMLNGFAHFPGTNTDIPNQVFHVGDFVDNTKFTPDGIEYWRCIVAGRHAASEKTFVTDDPIGNWGGDQSRQLFKLPADDYKELTAGDVLSFEDGAKARVISVQTEHLIEFTNPVGIPVNPGDQIDWFGWLNRWMQPVSYTDDTMTIPYQAAAYLPHYKVGDKEIIDKLEATVLEVVREKGIMRVKFSLPEGAEPSWYDKGNSVSLGADHVDRKPWDYDHSIPDQPAVWVGFPTKDIEEGAPVQVNLLTSTVRRVLTPGVSVEAIEGRIYGQRTFTIQKAEWKAYYYNSK